MSPLADDDYRYNRYNDRYDRSARPASNRRPANRIATNVYAQDITLQMIYWANNLVFAAWQGDAIGGQSFMSRNFLCSKEGIREGRYWVLATSLFSHSDWKHLTGNMLSFKMLAPALLRKIGVWKFLFFYLGTGVAANGFQVWKDARMSVLGASGSISAILGMMALIHPDAILSLGPDLDIPLLVYAPVYLLWETVQSLSRSNDGVAHTVHMVGLVLGLICGWREARVLNQPVSLSLMYAILRAHSKTALRLLLHFLRTD